MMNRRTLTQSAAALAAAAWLPWHTAALAAEEAPDALVKRLSADVLDTLRNDKSIKSGDVDKIIALVDKGQGHEIAQKIADRFEKEGFNAPRALPAFAAASASREA